MVTRRRGRPDSRMFRYPDPQLHSLRLEQIRRTRTGGLLPTPSAIGKRRLALSLAAWLLFLTGLFFVFF
ncbi:MAG: hypothetical protein J5944_05310 [Lentisphaeria bacterium]|nr:hypothetical protein [Lentisphaeria bacterium]